jgi:hypothetical protein
LKTDMCKEVFGNYGFQKTISPGHIWTTLYYTSIVIKSNGNIYFFLFVEIHFSFICSHHLGSLE